MSDTAPLRLIAEDSTDLEVISAALQDAVARAGNIRYRARARHFEIEFNRYRWEAEDSGRPAGRIRSLLAVDGVLSVRARGLTKSDPDLVVSLLQITFTPHGEPPGGVVTLTLAGDGELVLEVEALDVTLLDSDYAWPTRRRPDHARRRR